MTHRFDAPSVNESTSVVGSGGSGSDGGPDRATPERVGEFVVHGLLGRGGMGDVFAGYDPRLDRRVAIKRLRTDVPVDEYVRDRFRREAQLAARLRHPGVVAIYDVLMVDDVDYIISEFVDGPALDRLIARKTKWDVSRGDENLRIAIEVLDALEHAHRHGVLHLDVKAENILVARDGVAKLTDFGVGRVLRGLGRPGAANDPHKKGSGTERGLCGTPRAMAPEMVIGAEVDERADVFSYGVLLYEWFSGLSPFTRADFFKTLAALQHDVPRTLRSVVQGIPASLSQLVDQLLDKSPSDRPTLTHAGLVLERLRRELRGGRSARVDGRVDAVELQLAVGVLRVEFREEVGQPSQALARARKLDAMLDELAHAVENVSGMMLSESGNHFVFCVGYPLAHEDNTRRAAKLLLGLLSRFAASEGLTGTGIHISAALDAGVAVLVKGGRAPRVIGKVVDDALALSLFAEAGELLASPAAHNLLRRFFQIVPNVRVYSVAEGRAVPASRVVRARSELTDDSLPFVGRDQVMLALDETWLATQRGHGQVVVVAAAAGMGKTRLATVWASTLPRNTRVVRLRGTHEQTQVPCGAIRAWISSWIGIPTGATLTEKFDRLDQCVRQLGLESVRGSLEVVLELARPRSLDEPWTKRPCFGAVETDFLDSLADLLLFTGGAPPGSAVIIAEDVHWMDSVTVEVLRRVAQRIHALPAMLLTTSRAPLPEDHAWGRTTAIRQLELQPLSYDESRKVVETLSAGNPLSARRAEEIIGRAEGMPLLLEELVLCAGSIQDDKMFPTSMRESVQRRVAELGAVRRTLEVLAALGTDAPPELIRELVQRRQEALDVHLQDAERVGLVRRGLGGCGAVFRHALIRDAIEDGMSAADRQELHHEIVDLLECDFRSEVDARPDRYARHYEASGWTDRALELREAAGARATQRRAYVEANEHLDAALRTLASRPESHERNLSERRLRRLLGPTLIALEGWSAPRVKENYGRTEWLAAVTGEPLGLGETLGRWSSALVALDFETVDTILAELANVGDSPEGRLARDTIVGVTAFHRGDFETASRCLNAAAHAVLGTLEGRLGSEDTIQMALVEDWPEATLAGPSIHLAVLLGYQGRLREADQCQRDAERISLRSQTLFHAQSFSYGGRVFQSMIRHEPVYGDAGLTPLRALCGEHNPWFSYARAMLATGDGYLGARSGQGAAAADALSTGIDSFEQMELRLTLDLHAAACADAWRLVGDLDRARRFLDLARSQITPDRCGPYHCEVHLCEARYHRARGDLAAEQTAVAQARAAMQAIRTSQPLRLMQYWIEHYDSYHPAPRLDTES